MLIVTTNEIPGYQIDAVLGEVMGLTVRSVSIAKNFTAGFRSLAGGEIPEYTKVVLDSREQVIGRMIEQAAKRGANAVVAMRFDAGDIAANFSEICCYGTAVVISPIAEGEPGATKQSIGESNMMKQHHPAPGHPGAPGQPPVPPQPPHLGPEGHQPGHPIPGAPVPPPPGQPAPVNMPPNPGAPVPPREPGHPAPAHPEPGHPEPGHPEPGHPEPGHPEPPFPGAPVPPPAPENHEPGQVPPHPGHPEEPRP